MKLTKEDLVKMIKEEIESWHTPEEEEYLRQAEIERIESDPDFVGPPQSQKGSIKPIPVWEDKNEPLSLEGITQEQIYNIVKEACWDGYKQVGMKKKGGKNVPNCVPLEEKTKVTKPGQERVSKKIAHLVGKEGKSQEQAAAIAYSMEDRGELKKGGKHSVE